MLRRLQAACNVVHMLRRLQAACNVVLLSDIPQTQSASNCYSPLHQLNWVTLVN